MQHRSSTNLEKKKRQESEHFSVRPNQVFITKEFPRRNSPTYGDGKVHKPTVKNLPNVQILLAQMKLFAKLI